MYFIMKKKVLILGGAGFIGLGIARFLGENKDYDINCCQRYGFYNYVDWIKYGTKSKVESDDYININDKPRSNIEKIWVKYREENFNADTLYGSFISR